MYKFVHGKINGLIALFAIKKIIEINFKYTSFERIVIKEYLNGKLFYIKLTT